MSGDTIVFLLLVLFAIGNWYYQKHLKGNRRGISQPQITVTSLPNRHRSIVINYDVANNYGLNSLRIWSFIVVLSTILGVGLGYSIYRIWEWI